MWKILIVLLIILIYLNRSYAYFYDHLGKYHLTEPTHETKVIFPATEGAKTVKFLSLGDSLTAGVGTSNYKDSYPYLVAQKLSQKNNVELTNLAYPGDTSKNLVIEQMPQALLLKPDIVTVLIGTNDIHNLKSTKEFRKNYTQILSSLKETGARIYVMSIPYLGGKTVFIPYNLILDFRTKQFNQIIKKLAGQYNVTYIDLYSLPKSDNFYSVDQFHPSDQGYSSWAKIINVN